MLTDTDRLDEELEAPPPRPRRRRGFLPIVANWFDRLFIAIYAGVAIELLWLRFVEQALPLAVAHIIVLALAVAIVWRG